MNFTDLSLTEWEERFFLTSVKIYSSYVSLGKHGKVYMQSSLVQARMLIDMYQQETGLDICSRQVEQIADALVSQSAGK